MTTSLRRNLKRITWLRNAVVQSRYLWECARDRWFRDLNEMTDKSHVIKEWDFETPEVTERNRIIFAQLENHFGSLTQANVFELGCADGVFTRELSHRCAKVTAVDVSNVGLERAKKRCSGSLNIDFLKMNILEDCLPGKFDILFAMDVLEFLHGYDQFRKASNSLVSAMNQGSILVMSSCRAKPEIRTAVWQNIFPEGGDAYLDFLAKRKDLSLLHSEFHPLNGADVHGYIAHVIGIFKKV